MIFRLAKVSDKAKIFELINNNLDDYFSMDVIEFFLMQWPGGQVIAEDLFGNITGVICGSRLDNGTASISLFAVDSKCRGQGIGTELLKRFRTRCFMEGFSSIQLEVRTTNTNALNFYKKNGFAITENLYGFYSDGGDGYRMKCDLTRICRASS